MQPMVHVQMVMVFSSNDIIQLQVFLSAEHLHGIVPRGQSILLTQQAGTMLLQLSVASE